MFKKLLVRAGLLAFLPFLMLICLLLKPWWAYGNTSLRVNFAVWFEYFLRGELV
jgi:hypothetical protein